MSNWVTGASGAKANLVRVLVNRVIAAQEQAFVFTVPHSAPQLLSPAKDHHVS